MSTAKANSSANSTQQPKNESVSRRAAERAHAGIDQAAEKGEQFEETLKTRSAEAQAKAQELGDRVGTLARQNPWLAIGGSVAAGIVIGALLARR